MFNYVIHYVTGNYATNVGQHWTPADESPEDTFLQPSVRYSSTKVSTSGKKTSNFFFEKVLFLLCETCIFQQRLKNSHGKSCGFDRQFFKNDKKGFPQNIVKLFLLLRISTSETTPIYLQLHWKQILFWILKKYRSNPGFFYNFYNFCIQIPHRGNRTFLKPTSVRKHRTFWNNLYHLLLF